MSDTKANKDNKNIEKNVKKEKRINSLKNNLKKFTNEINEKQEINDFIKNSINFFTLQNTNKPKFDESLSLSVKIKKNAIKNLNIKNNLLLGFLNSNLSRGLRILSLDDLSKEDSLKDNHDYVVFNDQIITDIKKRIFNFNCIVSTKENLNKIKFVQKYLGGKRNFAPKKKLTLFDTKEDLINFIKNNIKNKLIPLKIDSFGNIFIKIGKINQNTEEELVNNAIFLLKQLILDFTDEKTKKKFENKNLLISIYKHLITSINLSATMSSALSFKF